MVKQSDLSASSSVASLLRDRTGLPRWADTGDLLFEVEETEEKFFWDLVREPFSSDTSSFAVAFRMLLKEKHEWKFRETSHGVCKHERLTDMGCFGQHRPDSLTNTVKTSNLVSGHT